MAHAAWVMYHEQKKEVFWFNFKISNQKETSSKKKSSKAHNGIQLKNPDISGAIFTLKLSILILYSHCVDGAKYVRVL